jgi:hypothetical protein
MTEPTSTKSEPALPNVYKGKVGNALFFFGVVMFLVFLGSAYMIAEHRTSYPVASIALGAVWIVGVPVFFFIEHVVLFREFGEPSQYEQFKRLQDLAGKVWAGAIVALAAFFTQSL